MCLLPARSERAMLADKMCATFFPLALCTRGIAVLFIVSQPHRSMLEQALARGGSAQDVSNFGMPCYLPVCLVVHGQRFMIMC